MTQRIVTDSAGRTWTCTSLTAPSDGSELGRDVVISCASPSVQGPVEITMGWQWETMASNGLARVISLRSPVPKF